MSNKISNWILFALHLAVAITVISAVWSHYHERLEEHQRIAENAEAAKRKSEQRSQDVKIKRQILQGLQEDDPYVIEKLARDLYDYRGQDELSPPRD